MSLRYLVVKAITERGCGTIAHIEPPLRAMGYTHKQIKSALHNAKNVGFLWCERGSGRDHPVYWPGKKEVAPMFRQLVAKKPEPARQYITSVFQLGNPLPESDWPKGWIGQVHRPLGEWNSTEEIA